MILAKSAIEWDKQYEKNIDYVIDISFISHY